jgi:hypothetical protein
MENSRMRTLKHLVATSKQHKVPKYSLAIISFSCIRFGLDTEVGSPLA